MKYTMGKASWCFITEDRVVKCYGLRNKKTVKPARGSIFDCWLRETTCLQRLKGHDHFPQLDDCEESDLSLSMSNCGESLFPAWKEHDLTRYIDQVHAIADTLEEAKIKYFYPGMDPAGKNKEHTKFPLSNFCVNDGVISLIDFEMAVPINSRAEDRLSDRRSYLYGFYNPDNFRESLVLALQKPVMSYEGELMAKLVDKDKFETVKHNNPRTQWASMELYTSPPDKVIKEWKNYQKRYQING